MLSAESESLVTRYVFIPGNPATQNSELSTQYSVLGTSRTRLTYNLTRMLTANAYERYIPLRQPD